MKSFYKWAVLHNYVADNPTVGLPSRWAATTKRRVLIPSVRDVLRLATALDEVSRNRSGDLAIVMGLVGLRWEELVGLPRDDDHVDMNRCMLRIDRSRHRGSAQRGGRRRVRGGGGPVLTLVARLQPLDKPDVRSGELRYNSC